LQKSADIFLLSLLAVTTSAVYLFYWHWVKYFRAGNKRIQWKCFFQVFKSRAGIALLLFNMVLIYSLPSCIGWFVAAVISFLYFMMMVIKRPMFSAQFMGISKTVLLALIWSWVTTILVLEGRAVWTSIMMLFVQRFLFLFPLCIYFDHKDRRSDMHAGRHTLATIFSKEKLRDILWLTWAGLFVITCVMILLDDQIFFPAVVSLIFITGILILQPVVRMTSDWFYYGIIDGALIYCPLAFYISSM
jgi:hypothetical protein